MNGFLADLTRWCLGLAAVTALALCTELPSAAAQAPDDIVIARDGARVLIDQVSLGYLAGSEIDFVDDLIGAAFRVNNPKATASCGCGTSFAL